SCRLKMKLSIYIIKNNYVCKLKIKLSIYTIFIFLWDMIKRNCFEKLVNSLHAMPVVALLGPRQVGKTTLAMDIMPFIGKPSTYLDLELDSDANKLSDPEGYLSRFSNELLIIDEVQRKPDLFRILRGLVDSRKRAGERTGHFLLLGSASRDLLQQSSETLAGRIRYLELTPFTVGEVRQTDPLDRKSVV